MSLSTSGFQSNTYNTDLVNVFPVTKYYSVRVTGNASTVSGTITISGPPNGGTKYVVFSSAYSGYPETSGTYNAINTAGALKHVVIYGIASNQFNWALGKNTGDNVNIYLIFMVVWNDALNYPKSY